MEKNSPIIHLPGKAPVLGAVGVGIEFLAKKTQTNGQWSCIVYNATAKFSGPPPHYHKALEEAFFVLEGTLTLLVNGDTLEVGPGGFASIPPGNVHTFANRSDLPVKMLIFFSPGGFEQYFEELGELLRSDPSWPPKDMAPIAALMTKYDTFLPGK